MNAQNTGIQFDRYKCNQCGGKDFRVFQSKDKIRLTVQCKNDHPLINLTRKEEVEPVAIQKGTD